MSAAVDSAALRRDAERLLQRGDAAGAIAAYRALLDVAPDRADDWYNLGYVLRADRQFDSALDAYDAALARGMGRPEAARVNRAAILSEHLLRFDTAEAELRAALVAAPQFLPAWHNLGQLQEDMNNRAAARATYQAVLAFAPYDGRAHARLTALDVFDGNARSAIARMSAPMAAARDPVDRAELEFAFANALDAVGDYDAAFDAATRANALAATLMPRRYDPAAQDGLIDALIAAFSEPAPDTGERTTPDLIFVCGMFRSGSTLCEQVLARHSHVTAGGELEAIPAMVAGLSPYPAAATTLSVDQRTGLRDRYLAEAKRLFPDAMLLSDKRCDNFLHIGLIKTLFPAARIVHTVRDPRDTMLSAFFLFFGAGVPYATSLDDFAHYYRSYRRLMAHWDALYPDIVRFDYDAFVTAPESGARALFGALGLGWEEGCDLARPFNANVRTASAWQVRQPVHTRSTARWRNYARQIATADLPLRS